MTALRTLIPLALCLTSATAEARTDPLTPGLSLTDAMPRLEEACQAQQRFDVSPTVFPNAETSETHILCRGYTLPDGRAAGDAVMTFADGTLVAIETRGAVEAMRPEADPVAEIDGFEVFMPDMVVTHAATGQAFAIADLELAWMPLGWDNPVWRNESPEVPVAPFAVPEIIRFGSDVAAIEAEAEHACSFAVLRDIDEAWLLTEPERQQQLDCVGPVVAGYPRKLELVFGDGQLEQVWLLLGPADVPRLRDLLVARYGPPVHIDATYEVFDDWHIALRKDRPELLFGSDRLTAIWRSEGL